MASKKQLEREIDCLRDKLHKVEAIVDWQIRAEFIEGFYGSEVTLNGKVNAILKHLGLEAEVTERKAPKVVLTKKGKK